MITTCTECGGLYEAGSEEQANEQERLCFECRIPVEYCHECSLAGGADRPVYHRPPICKPSQPAEAHP